MENEVNSREYWEARFKGNDWNDNNGDKQTLFFANLFYRLCPTWIKEYLDGKNLKYLDVGCAEGEGISFLHDHFTGTFEGIDFSESAVKTASKKYNDIKFTCMDINDLHGEWDVSYISNVLEHFVDPIGTLRKVCKVTNKIVFVLVPFEENESFDEHVAKFSYENIPTTIDDFSLICCGTGIDQTVDSQFVEQEVLLVYSKDKELNNKATISKNYQIIRNNITDEDYAKYKSLYVTEGEKRVSAEKRSEILAYQNSVLNEDLAALKAEKDQINEDLVALKAEKDQINEDLVALKAEKDQIEQDKKKLQLVYDDLYSYSYYRDIRLDGIENSKSYKVYKKCFYPPMRYSYVVLHKFYVIIKKLLKRDFKGAWDEIFYSTKNKVSLLKGKKEQKSVLKKIEHSVSGKRVIVFPPTLDWNMELFQRPQQLAMAYAGKPNTVVIYLTANMKYDKVSCGEEIMDNLWLVNCAFCDKLNTVLKNADSVILSISWTRNKIYLERIKHDYVIYEYIDEISIFDGYDENMERDHISMLKGADVTVCTATKLFNQAKGVAKNPILSPNAGDYNFFATARNAKLNAKLVNKIEKYKIRLGYYGALAEWFDYDLIKQIASRHSDWLWILVGMDYDKTLGKSGVLDLENVLYIPPQPYKALPSFLTAFDIATIPFKINEITLSTSPVKLFEYMSAKKPILTSKMPECLKYKSVYTYADADEFEENVKSIMNLDSKDKYWEILESDAQNNTWKARTDEILDAISSLKK